MNTANGRTVYHLVHRNADSRWHLAVENGKDVSDWTTKHEAEQEGERLGNAHQQRGELAQLIVHRQDGSIEREYTYGKDPRRTPG
ncbi:DUF2188 domain-containing protein [Tahibacter sp.]|uniref:DUF2188 domain-containing protein n=1 Tax=Tahibacter sp. TaxID=2056211 RepID=UPI0028C44F08|nr:DUF2188 domain-containing protein [Tahibacter sp.]